MNKQFVKYYNRNFDNLREASNKLGFSPATIWLWLNGSTKPHKKNQRTIYNITNKRVPIASWRMRK